MNIDTFCRYLEVAQAAEKVDVIVVLGGDDGARIVKAAQLYAQGYASKVLMTGFSPFPDAAVKMGTTNGIPAEALIIEPKASCTRENASCSAPLLRKRGVRTAILVTSWYHSRRALGCFRRAMPEIRFVSVPVPQDGEYLNQRMIREEFWKTLYSSLLGWIWV